MKAAVHGRTRDAHVYFRPQDYEAAKRLADRLGQSFPTFVERAVLAAIQQHREADENRRNKGK